MNPDNIADGTGELPAFDVLGTRVLAVDIAGAVNCVERWVAGADCGHYVCVTGVHGIMEGSRDKAIQRVHNAADAVVPDGMPLVWLGHRRGYRYMRRVYGPDLMLAVMQHAATAGWTSFLLGGAPGVADELKRRMEARFPGVKVVGTHCPPYRPLTEVEESAVLADIDRLRPDLLWVGLSTPKQELLMARWKARGVKAKVMLGVGAAFDFHTGRVRQAPVWLQRTGLEWLFRLCMEPRRLGPRYLRNNPAFLWSLLCESLSRRHRLAE